MRYLLLCLLLMLGVGVSAAEFHNGQLVLEVNLATASKIQLKAESGQIIIGELEGLMSRDFASELTISVVNPEAVTYYGILDRKEMICDAVEDENAVVREFFAWENSHLIIKRECLYFLPQSFSSREEADAFALWHNIQPNRIMEIPMINSTVLVQPKKGEAVYLETPLKLSSGSDLSINGQTLKYSGEFILKTVKNQLVLNQSLNLEEYLAGVIQNEIGNKSPLEALKAQAVAARTHALSLLANNRHKADGYDLCSSTHCQVYKGAYLQNATIHQAVNETANEALFANSVIADATYHSSCGGKTDASSTIWRGKPIPHLNGVTCIAEADSLDLTCEADARKWIETKSDSNGMSSWERGALSWDKQISRKQLAASLGMARINRIEILERGHSGRIVSMRFSGDKQVKLDNEYKIRQAFGNLFSSFFYIKGAYSIDGEVVSIHPKDLILLKGKGAGHGVGMCQVGALKMAREGSRYQDILQQYYPGTLISKDWNSDK
ncbi:MAG: SpoIID/LytB domain-containing protein [Candidatus Cloacimonas sp.]|jgi:SpoIID/LytB domain protein|nr:SpoIID/LytB domain-containing protein [Candidatus Cloacimonas sp.]